MIDIKIITGNEQLQKALAIRREVFVMGQNVPLEREMDGLDEQATQGSIAL